MKDPPKHLVDGESYASLGRAGVACPICTLSVAIANIELLGFGASRLAGVHQKLACASRHSGMLNYLSHLKVREKKAVSSSKVNTGIVDVGSETLNRCSTRSGQARACVYWKVTSGLLTFHLAYLPVLLYTVPLAAGKSTCG